MEEDLRETGVSHVRGDPMYVSSSESPMISRIRKLAQENPDEVCIIKQPEDNYGCIYARMPFYYLKLSSPRRLNLTDEERAQRSERMRRVRIDKPAKK